MTAALHEAFTNASRCRGNFEQGCASAWYAAGGPFVRFVAGVLFVRFVAGGLIVRFV